MIQFYTLRTGRELLFDKLSLTQINIAQKSQRKSKQTNAQGRDIGMLLKEERIMSRSPIHSFCM